MIEYGGTPADWVVDAGRPARVLGPGGFPSYESEDGTLVVLDFLAAFRESGTGSYKLFSRSYTHVAAVAPDGMVPLHRQSCSQHLALVREWDGRYGEEPWDQEEAVEMGLGPYAIDEIEYEPEPFEWRPIIRRWAWDGVAYWRRMGSQQELAWRQGLFETLRNRYVHGMSEEENREAWTMHDAAERAETLLISMLSPQQRIELLASLGTFRVRGGKTRRLYAIQISNGFELLDEITGEPLASFCLHPEGYIPHEDVALATKLQLEDPEREEDCVANARQTPLPGPSRPTEDDLVAARYERELIR